MSNNEIEIEHGFYDGAMGNTGIFSRKLGEYIPMAIKLRSYLAEKFIKFKKPVEFTYGLDPHTHIECVAVCHPKDQFKRDTGRKIVTGRIMRHRGDLLVFTYRHYKDKDGMDRVRRDKNGERIVIKTKIKASYDLTLLKEDGKLKYPYIYQLS